MTTGSMKTQAIKRDAASMPNLCPSHPPVRAANAAPAWNGWSADGLTNRRFQEAEAVWNRAADFSVRGSWNGHDPRLLSKNPSECDLPGEIPPTRPDRPRAAVLSRRKADEGVGLT